MIAYIASLRLFLIRSSFFYFIIFFLMIDYLINFPFFFIGIPEEMASNLPLEQIKGYDLGFQIMLVIFIGPLMETFIFQYTIIKLVRILIHDPNIKFFLAIILSASAFSISHYYNIYYFLFGITSGFILAVAFYIAIYRKEPAFLTIFLIHSIWNSIAFITN